MYKNFMISNMLKKFVIHTIDVQFNPSTIDNLQGLLYYPNFNEMKAVVVGCLVMLTFNIN
jgi:hypothetical protein